MVTCKKLSARWRLRRSAALSFYYGTPSILIFPCQTGWQYSDRNPLNRGVERMQVVWQKTRFWTNIAAHTAYRSTVLQTVRREVWKIKPRQTVSSRALTAASVIRCSHKTTTKCLWRDRRYAGDGGQAPPPDTTPLVITPFSAAVGHRRTEPGGYFCWKLTLTRTPDPIRPTRRGFDPNRPTNGRK